MCVLCNFSCFSRTSGGAYRYFVCLQESVSALGFAFQPATVFCAQVCKYTRGKMHMDTIYNVLQCVCVRVWTCPVLQYRKEICQFLVTVYFVYCMSVSVHTGMLERTREIWISVLCWKPLRSEKRYLVCKTVKHWVTNCIFFLLKTPSCFLSPSCIHISILWLTGRRSL